MKKTVLVVDVDPDLIYAIKIGFEDIGANYEIIAAESGKKCLEMLKNNEIPDLILLDIMMPEIDGWDVAAEILKNPNWSKIPIVFLTAKTDDFSKTFGNIVCNDYITKPFEIAKLKESIDKVLKR